MRQRREASGFALAVVLWVLAGLTVVAVTVAGSAGNHARSVKLLRDRVEAEKAFISTQSRVAILAATAIAQRETLDSLGGRLFADGRWTKVDERESVQLQDSRGLINLNAPDRERFARLLLRCGASEGQVPSLVDALSDYTDVDDFKRVNGAEAFEYRGRGLAEPRNSKLLSRDELWRVLGFADIRDKWQAAGCDQFVTVHGDIAFNNNTAPHALLVAGGMSESAADALILAREQGLSSLDLISRGDDPSNPYNFVSAGYVGRVLRVRHQMDSVQWLSEYELELSPQRSGGPWRIHELRTPRKPDQVIKAGAVLPAADFRVSEREQNQLNASPRLPFAN